MCAAIAILTAVFPLTMCAPQAFARTVLTAQSGLVPWKGATSIPNLSARTSFESFLRTHPGVEVVAFEQLRLPGVHENAVQVMSIAGTAGPDIALVFFPDLGGYVREGLIQPLDDLVAAWPGKDRWPPSLVSDLKLEGRDWGVVVGASYALLAGNRATFADHGLKARDMPESWDDLVKLATRLTSPGQRAGFGIVGGKPLAYLWMALTRQAGGERTVRLERHGLEVNLLDDASRRAAEFIAHLGQQFRDAGPGVLTVTDTGKGLRQFARERRIAIALTTDGDAVLTTDEGNRYMYPQPPLLSAIPGAFTTEPLAYAQSGQFVIIPSFVRDARRRQLIWEFHTTGSWAGVPLEQTWLEMAARTGGRIPPYFTIRYPDHPAVRNFPSEWGPAMERATAQARPMPPDLEFEQLAEILGKKLTGLLLQGGDPVAVLRAAQKEFDSTVRLTTRRASWTWRVIGWGALGLFAAAFGYGLLRLGLTLRDELKELRVTPAQAMTPTRWLFALGLFAPAVSLAIVFGVLPLLKGLYMSTFAHVLRDGGTFTGLTNYLDVIASPVTHGAVLNTLFYLLLSFFLGFVAPLLLALVLANLPWMKFIIRTAFFFPAVASAVVIAMIWQQIYAGPFNSLVTLLGFSPRNWLGEPGVAMFSVVLAQAWSTLGVSGLIYLAGLSAIPEELYEDAEIAGAGLVERFTSVTLPFLAPLIGISLVGWLISVARTSEHVFLMTGGGPAKATYVLGLDIFTQAYVNIRFGYAMAEVWLLVSVILIFSIYQMRAIRRGQLRLLEE